MERYLAVQFLTSAEFEELTQMVFFFTINQVSKKVNGCFEYKRDLAEEIQAEAMAKFVEYVLNDKNSVESKEGLVCKIVLNIIADRGKNRNKFYNRILKDSDHIFSEGQSLEDYSPEALLVLENDLNDLVKEAKLNIIESKVITMLNHGYNKKSIAERLNVSPPYISQVVKAAKEKFL
ncbi:hypothetical protein [Spirosoma sp.]|uniref:hypothetical protein n=1 Tax=Spirosoma sp. TaxID=1899569 RepID=UPI003B3AA6F4